MLYVDTSAFLKRHIREPESASCERVLLADPRWVTARHTLVEVQRNLSRLLTPRPLQTALAAFGRDWARTHVVELDATTCERAAEVARLTGAGTLDALHLAAALRVGGPLVFLTYDLRQAVAARQLGLTVMGT